mgnify:CR=1 FL=1
MIDYTTRGYIAYGVVVIVGVVVLGMIAYLVASVIEQRKMENISLPTLEDPEEKAAREAEEAKQRAREGLAPAFDNSTDDDNPILAEARHTRASMKIE